VGIAKTKLKAEYLKGILTAGGPISIQTNAKAVAAEIQRIIRNPNLYSIISQKSQAFAAKMSWDHVVDQYLRLWKDSDTS
jgi:hypothetical protein